VASVVDICNRALQKLGAIRIDSITDTGSLAARELNAAFEFIRDSELRDHPWNFAIQRFQLAASGTAPSFGPSNAYPLPTGWMRVLSPDPRFNGNDRDWIIEGNSILSDDDSPLDVRCVMQVTDTTKMDPLFREALSARIAYELCEKLTQSNEKRQAAAADYKEIISRAKKVNAIEKVPEEPVDDTFITCRL
jgi:hypothetical protein